MPEIFTGHAMQLRLETKSDVRKFAVSITMIALSGCAMLQYLMLPADVYDRVLFRGLAISVILALPISYIVGLRLMDVHRLTSELEHAVHHDTLTGLCNRISFYHRLDGLEDMPLVMIAVDVDHFKKINDEFGHQAGDHVLKQFAVTLLRNCREDDVVARFGGEEFVILLRDTTLEEGVLAAERLCCRVREKAFLREVPADEDHRQFRCGRSGLDRAD